MISKKAFILLCVSVGLMACTPDTSCRTESNVQLKIAFFSDSLNTKTGQQVVYTQPLDSLTVKGKNNDSILYDNQKKLSSIYLPLQKNASESQFELICNGQLEILTIQHSNTDYFVSLACGCVVYHSLDSVFAIGNAIDSISITNQQVTAIDEEHIRLFFK